MVRHAIIIANIVLCAGLTMAATAIADTITLYAAGSLKGALSEMAKAYEAKSGNKVETRFGPSGLLKDRIAGGEKADVFASANMAHPRALHEAGKAGPVTRFARNKLCALVKPDLNVTNDNLLAQMLDEKVKLGTSTPKADPSGDYAFAAFAKAEAIKPGAKAALEKKAIKLTGAKDSATPPAGRIAYGWHVNEGRADIFLTYCTNALAAQKQYPGQQKVELPEALSVGADYGLTVIAGASPAAQSLAEYIRSADGEEILASYGFASGK
jgi:molybdate transport system substrate-binding protein